MPGFLEDFSWLDDSQGGDVSGSYLNSDPRELLTNPVFLDELREYYVDIKGEKLYDNEELVERFYRDRTFSEYNVTLGITSDALDTQAAGSRELQLKQNIARAYTDVLPSFWEEGGMGGYSPKATLQGIGLGLADPLNLIAPARAATAAATAARTAALQGKNVALAGAKAGGYTGAVTEAAVAAPITALADVATQGRNIHMGIQDEYSGLQTATATGRGALLGGVTGGVLGAGAGAMFGRSGARDLQRADMQRVYGDVIDKEDRNTFARLDSLMGKDLNANERLLDQETLFLTEQQLQRQADIDAAAAPNPNAGDATDTPKGFTVDDIDIDIVNRNVEAARAAYREAASDPLIDEELLGDLQAELDSAEEIAALQGRVANYETQVKRLIESNVGSDANSGLTRNHKLQEVIGSYKRLLQRVERENMPAEEEAAEIARINKLLTDDAPEPTAPVVDGQPAAAPTAQAPTQAAPTQAAPDQPAPAKAAPDGEPQSTTAGLNGIRLRRVYETPDENGNPVVEDTMVSASALYKEQEDSFSTLYKIRECMGG